MEEKPPLEKESRNSYMNAYMKKRYAQRRQMFIERLGGVCVKCQSTDELELDHIDASQKKFNIAKFFNYRLEVVLPEVDKCQLLCSKCHIEKTIIDKGHKPAKGTHGTLSSYKYCKCSICKSAKSSHHAAYMRKRRAAERNPS